MIKSISAGEMDMTQGPILKKMVQFSIPLMFSTILQLLYNAADTVVVGRFAGSQALAAVGATGSITSLLINLFMGLSIGTNVIIAQYYGANESRAVSESVHTSVLLSFLGGVLLGLLGMFLARPLLTAMNTPEDVLDQAVLYMSICFAGLPATSLYNFCAAILRAIGDTKRPLYYLTISGVINVILNLIFVIVFHMDVAGVALATIIAQVVSVVLVIRCLMRLQGIVRLDLRKLRLHRGMLIKILQIGIPAGLQNSMFAIANTLLQSSVNAFGSTIIAANTAAANIEQFVATPLGAFSQAVMSFAGQNFGARKYDRLGKIIWRGLFLVAGFGITAGFAVAFLGNYLIRIYTQDAAVIEWGVTRMRFLATTCFINHIAEVFVAGLRAMGKSLLPMLASIMCICVFRIFWIYTVFAAFPTLIVLYLSYPASWSLSAAVQSIIFLVCKRKLTKCTA